MKNQNNPEQNEPTTEKNISPDMSSGVKGVISVAEAMVPAIEMLRKASEKFTAFANKLREDLKEVEPERCDDHEDVELPLNWDRTLAESYRSNKPIPVYDGCPKCKAIAKGSLVNERWIKMGIPFKVMHATISNYEAKSEGQRRLLLKAQKTITRGRGFLIIRGTPGTGKSHLAAAILKHVGEGIFVTEADLIGELRKTYETNSGQEAMVEKYRNCKVFVLDELTTEVKGVDIPQLLYRILAWRYDRGLLVVITSNETLEVILSILGPRLTDRVCEGYMVATAEWDSYRKEEKA